MKKISLILILAMLVACCFGGCVSDVPEDVNKTPIFEVDDNNTPSIDIEDNNDSQNINTDVDVPDDSENSSTATDVCNHQFTAATCEAPKTCNLCGAIEGNALAHAWQSATCITPKTCSVCGKIEGKVLGHAYINGKCNSCGQTDPSYTQSNMVWIPKSGKKYHSKPNCSNMKNPSQVSKSSAIAQGFTACKNCYG